MNTTRFNNDSSRFHSIQFLTSIPEESVHFHLILHNSTQFRATQLTMHLEIFLCCKIFALTSIYGTRYGTVPDMAQYQIWHSCDVKARLPQALLF